MSGGWLYDLNPTSASDNGITPLKYDRPAWLFSMTGCDGRMLAVTNEFSGWDQLVEASPADANVRFIGPLQTPWFNAGVKIEWHPQWRRLLGVAGDRLFEVDPSTAQVTVLATLSSGPSWPQNLAIDSQGRAYATTTTLVGSTRLFQINLQSGWVTDLGTLPLGPPGFIDLAFDRFDQLWGFYVDGFAPHDDGIYRIDIPSVSAWNVRPTSHWGGGPFFEALAFVPEPIVGAYCTAKTNSAGCVPSIAGQGWPSASVQEGFWVSASQVVNQSTGLLFLGAAGRASVPFAGGTFCVAGPIVRTPPLNSGGSKASQIDCTGLWRRDFNEWHTQQPGLLAGVTVNAQWYGRDPGLAAPANVQLSNALEFVLLP